MNYSELFSTMRLCKYISLLILFYPRQTFAPREGGIHGMVSNQVYVQRAMYVHLAMCMQCTYTAYTKHIIKSRLDAQYLNHL